VCSFYKWIVAKAWSDNVDIVMLNFTHMAGKCVCVRDWHVSDTSFPSLVYNLKHCNFTDVVSINLHWTACQSFWNWHLKLEENWKKIFWSNQKCRSYRCLLASESKWQITTMQKFVLHGNVSKICCKVRHVAMVATSWSAVSLTLLLSC